MGKKADILITFNDKWSAKSFESELVKAGLDADEVKVRKVRNSEEHIAHVFTSLDIHKNTIVKKVLMNKFELKQDDVDKAFPGFEFESDEIEVVEPKTVK